MGDHRRENKRTRQACTNCRRKKTRCPGERPVCSFCARLGQDCYYNDSQEKEATADAFANILQQNSGLAARVALLESRLSLLDPSGSSDLLLPDPTTNMSSSQAECAVGSPDQQIWNGDLASLLDANMLESLTNTYFLHCHKQPYSYFHEETFRRAVQNEVLPTYLILAFAATAIRFSNETPFAGRQSEAIDWYAKLAWSELVEQSFSDADGLTIRAVQAASLLGVVDHVAGRDQLAWVKFGLSIRFAQALQLGKEPDPLMPSNEAEERRSTFWSIYVLDRLASCGRHRPPVLVDAECTLRLPVASDTRPNTDAPTLASIHTIPDQALLQPSDHFALVIFMVSVFGDVVKWTFEHIATDTHLPWASHSEFSRISGLLYSFESYSDEFDGNIDHRLDQQFGADGALDELKTCHFVYAHVLYHVNQCLLHHPFLIRQRLKSRNVKVPLGFLKRAIAKSEEHASHLTTILRRLQQRDCPTYHPSFYGYAAVLAGVIHRLRSADHQSSDALSAYSAWESCIHFLDQEPTIWPSYKRMSGVLKDFEPSPKLAASLMSPTMSPMVFEEVSEEGLWHICDYGWLSNIARRASSSNETPRPAIDSPDFETLLEGALSFDFALLNQQTDTSATNTLFNF